MVVLQAATLGLFVAMLQMLFTYVMPWIGVLAILAVVGFKMTPYLPRKVQLPIAKRFLYTAVAIIGPDVMLIREEDGRYTMAPYTYDADNGVYWVDYGNEEVGFDAGGVGGEALPFASGTLLPAYSGLGAAADFVSARIGREAKKKHGVDEARGAEGGALPRGSEPVADGGAPADVEDELVETEVALPDRGVIADLRNVMSMAPYHLRPSVIKRVEKNAKASQKQFGNWGAYAQMGGMMAAFFLGGLLVWFVTRDGGSSGGGAVNSVSVNMIAPLLGVL